MGSERRTMEKHPGICRWDGNNTLLGYIDKVVVVSHFGREFLLR